jgi:hypothetical protein
MNKNEQDPKPTSSRYVRIGLIVALVVVVGASAATMGKVKATVLSKPIVGAGGVFG